MTLTTKITLMLLCVTIAMVGINYTVLDSTVSSSFTKLERESAVLNTQRVERAIDQESEYVSRIAMDWGYWDDTREYALGNYPNYVEQNLSNESLISLRVNTLFIVDNAGMVLWGRSFDLESEEEIVVAEFPENAPWKKHPLLQHPTATADDIKRGLVMTDHGLMAVASAPILETGRTGASAGTLMFGKFINEPVIESLINQTNVRFELLAPEVSALPEYSEAMREPVIREQSDSVLSGYAVLRDVTGAPISVIKSATSRDITQNGRRTVHLALGLLIAAGIAGIIGVAVGLRVIALGPLKRLAKTVVTVGHTGNLKLRSAIARRDEIGVLSKQFDEMLDELAVAREAVREQSYYTGILEMSAGLMHNLRNSLNPVKTGIWSALEILRRNRLENFNRAIKELSDLDGDADRRRKLFAYVGEAASAITDERVSLIERIEAIGHETDAIATILDQQNKLNRPDLCIERVDLGEVLARAPKQVPDGHGIVLDVVCDDDEPIVMGNQILLSQVVENLVVNAVEAIKATGRGHGTIKIFAEFDRSAAAPTARITIKDDGDGIAPEIKAKLFGRGFSTRKQESGGLGLHWCANTLIAMGGKISLDSAGIGMGTTVQIDLVPAATSDHRAAA